MKPTKLGELTIIHDPNSVFGVSEPYYIHGRVSMRDFHGNLLYERDWLVTQEEASRIEARAARGLEYLPDPAQGTCLTVFMIGIIVGVTLTMSAFILF